MGSKKENIVPKIGFGPKKIMGDKQMILGLKNLGSKIVSKKNCVKKELGSVNFRVKQNIWNTLQTPIQSTFSHVSATFQTQSRHLLDTFTHPPVHFHQIQYLLTISMKWNYVSFFFWHGKRTFKPAPVEFKLSWSLSKKSLKNILGPIESN